MLEDNIKVNLKEMGR